MNYKKYIHEKNFIKITLIDDGRVNWFIIDETDDFILIINENDFIIDWYKLIKKDFIKKVSYGKQEKFYQNLYKINNIKIPATKLEINLMNLLNKFKKDKEFIIIETYKKKKLSFDLWPITNIGTNYISLKPISSLWKFEKIKKISTSDIDVLSRWDRYSKVFEKSITSKK